MTQRPLRVAQIQGPPRVVRLAPMPDALSCKCPTTSASFMPFAQFCGASTGGRSRTRAVQPVPDTMRVVAEGPFLADLAPYASIQAETAWVAKSRKRGSTLSPGDDRR